MSFVGRVRPAGEKLLHFFQTGLGEEVLEGVVGGGMAGAALLSTDQPIEQTALQTALAMAGGVGLGMGARRIGARMGRAINPNALADQQGLMASLGRMSGQEGLITGARDSISSMAQGMKRTMREGTIDDLTIAFRRNPQDIASKLGMSVEEVEQVLPLMARADEVITPKAAQRIDQMADGFKKDGAKMSASQSDQAQIAGDFQQFLGNAMSSDPSLITGEHIGRMIGRAAGDESGIVGGLAIGGLIGNQMGWESEKDKQIRVLQEELGQR